MLRTSIAPMPRTFAPLRAVAMDLAIDSVLGTSRPTMQALAPRCTRARTIALQIVPLPPVQKTTLLSKHHIDYVSPVQTIHELLEARN